MGKFMNCAQLVAFCRMTGCFSAFFFSSKPTPSGLFMKHKILCRLVPLLVFAAGAVISLRAGIPLGVVPGVATNVVLGSCTNLAAFNTSLNSGDMGMDNTDLTNRQYTVRLPAGYDPSNTNKKYGLVTFIDANDVSSFRSSWAAGLDSNNVIYLAAQGVGNPQYTYYRYGRTIMGSFRMCELFNIDRNRIFVSGFSGGGFSSSALAFLRSDWYHGTFPWAGSCISQPIPGVMAVVVATGAKPPVAMPTYFRTSEMTHYSDFNRDKATYVYRYARLNYGGNAREIMRPGGHTADDGDGLTDALSFMYHPLVDIIWDRFEGGMLGANVGSPDKVTAGTGWAPISGSVSENTYAYNGTNLGALWLKGDGAAVCSKDTFTWQNNFGILADARLRAETLAGQNQQIGLHIVPSSFTNGVAANQPGFHVYWCYGQPYRAELMSATGVRKTLATWQFTNPPPMSLPTSDVTFWDSQAAPDYAGRMQIFRGEDVRLHLSSVGFQLTFNRPVATMTTSYTTGVNGGIQACPDMDPILVQGYWSDVETALVNTLPAGNWKLVLSNDALVSGQPTGNAVIDEIHLVGSTGVLAAPAPVNAAAPPNLRTFTWGQIAGAMGYIIQRADSPDGPFLTVATAVNTNSIYLDTNAPQSRAYYYRVAAIGSDGSTGSWSAVASAASAAVLPAAPTYLDCIGLATNQAQLVWTDNANNEIGYRVERSPAGLAQWALVSGLLATNTAAFTDTNLAAATAYDYRVSALGSNGLSGYATLTLTIPAATAGAVSVPGGLAAIVTNNSVALSWNAATGNAYNVKRGSSAAGPFVLVAAGLTGLAYTDPSLLPGTYYYVVSSVSGPAESANSTAISVGMSDTVPPVITVPATLNVTATSTNGAVVNFTVTATDQVSGACPVTCVPASGTTFPPGTTVVMATTSDAVGNAATNTFLVSVQPYTSTAPSGYWAADADGFWSSPGSWSGGILPNNGGAYFDAVDISADRTVYLDRSVSLSNLSFGDGNPNSSASWRLNNNGNYGAGITLTSTNPVINVNAMGQGGSVTISANVAGTNGLIKTGPGNLILPLPTTYTGNTTVSGGTLTVQGYNVSSGFAVASNAVVELNVASGSLDGPNVIYSGNGTLRKTGSGQAMWGGASATFALSSGSLIDVQGGTFTGGSNGNENWTNNLSDLNVGPNGIFDGVEANVCVDALTGTGSILSGYSGAGYQSFSFGVNNGSGTFYGSLGDSSMAGSYLKAGTGTQVLVGRNTYTGSTLINNGVLQIGDGVIDGTIASSTSITNYGTLSYNLVGAQIGAAPMSGTGNLVKAGPGSLTLSGTNSASGTITVSGGTLQLVRTNSLYGGNTALWGNTNLNVQAGATLAVNVGGTNEFSATKVTTLLNGMAASSGPANGMNAGSALGFDTTDATGGTFTLADHLTDIGGAGGGSRGLTKLGANTLVLSGTNTYSGRTVVNAGILQFARTQSLYGGNSANWTPANINVQNGGTLAVNVGGPNEFMAANVTALLNQFGTSAGTGNGMNAGSALGFDTTDATGGTFTLADNLTDIGGAGGGSRGLTKLGANTLVLSGTNTYTGNTLVKQGTLVLAGSLALQNSTLDTTGGGNIVVSNTASLTLGGLTGTNAVASAINGYASLTDLIFNVPSSQTEAYVGVISNSATSLNVTKTGGGLLILSGTNMYKGSTTIAAGTLQIGNGITDGSITNSSGITNNGTLVYNLVGSQTLSALQGTGALVKAGPGTLTVTVSNNSPASLNILGGILKIGGAGSLGASGSYAAPITNNGTLQYASSISQTLSGLITGTGGLNVSGGTGRLTLTGANDFSGPVNASGNLSLGNAYALGYASSLSFGGGQFDNASTSPLVLANNLPITWTWNSQFNGTGSLNLGAGSVNLTYNNMQWATLVVNANTAGSVLTIGGVISGGAQNMLVKSGGGTLALTNVGSTFTGPVSIVGGMLTVPYLANGGSSSSIGAPPNTPMNLRLAGGGTLQYTGTGAAIDRNFTVLPGGGAIDASGTGPLSFTNNGILSPDVASHTATVTNTAVASLSGNGSLDLWSGMPVAGSGITNGTTLSGLVGVNAATLSVAATNSGTPTLTFGYGVRTLTLKGSNSAANTLAGVLQDSATVGGLPGTLSLVKSGPGTWVLAGKNTYTGPTTVSNGILYVNSPGTIAYSTNVTTVNAGATLTGDGTVSNAVILSSATISPGNSTNLTGTLTLATNLTLNGGYLNVNLATPNVAGGCSLLAIGGTNTLTANTIVQLTAVTGTITNGNYTLLTCLTNVGTNLFTFLNGRTNYSVGSATLTLIKGATNLVLNVSGGNVGGLNFTWNGGVNGSWDFSTTNWLNNGVPQTYADGEMLLFDDTAAVFTLTNASPVTLAPFSMTFSNNANAYVLSSNLSLAGNVQVFLNGAGSVTTYGANSYTGPTTINAGTLTIAGRGVLGNGNYATNILNNGAFVYASSATQTVSGIISGAGPLTNAGSGTLRLNNTGNAVYNGNITVSQGVLKTGNDATASMTGVLGNPATARQITIGSGATLAFGNFDTFYGWISTPPVTLNINGTVTNSAGLGYINALGPVNFNGGTLAASAGYASSSPAGVAYALWSGGPVTASGALSTISLTGGSWIGLQGNVPFNVSGGAVLNVAGILRNSPGGPVGGLIKSGPGTLLFNATNAYTGTTTVSSGTLLVNGDSSAVTNTWTVSPGAALGGTGLIGGVVNYQSGAQAVFTVTPTNTAYSNSTYLTFTNQVYLTNLAVRLLLPTNGLARGVYVLATNLVITATNGLFAAPTLDSGAYAPASTGSVSLVGKNLVLTVVGVVTGPPVFNAQSLTGNAWMLHATNGVPNAGWTLLQSTNLSLPLSQWLTNRTGTYDALGTLNLTNLLNPADNPACYFMLK